MVGSHSLIDHVFVNKINTECSVFTSGLLDHNVSLVTLHFDNIISQSKAKYKYVGTFSDLGIQLFCHLRSKENWDRVYTVSDLNSNMNCSYIIRFDLDMTFPKS